MTAETLRIVSQAREATERSTKTAEERRSREERTWGLRERAEELLRTHHNEIYQNTDFLSRVTRAIGFEAVSPILRMNFGEHGERVEVVISARVYSDRHIYEANLGTAAIQIQVGEHLSLSLPPKWLGFDKSYCYYELPESEKLDLYGELLGEIEKQFGVGAEGEGR